MGCDAIYLAGALLIAEEAYKVVEGAVWIAASPSVSLVSSTYYGARYLVKRNSADLSMLKWWGVGMVFPVAGGLWQYKNMRPRSMI